MKFDVVPETGPGHCLDRLQSHTFHLR